MSIECTLCYSENPDDAANCEQCGAPLNNAQAREPDLLLTEKASSRIIKISGEIIRKEEEATLVIGREGNVEPQYFAEFKHISRKHCKVILENGEYKIEHIATAVNPTKINNFALIPGIKRIMRDRETLTIADKEFAVSICRNNILKEVDITSKTEQEITGVTEVKYIIICPRCGTEYEVQDIKTTIDECKNCNKYDKGYISQEKARVKNAD